MHVNKITLLYIKMYTKNVDLKTFGTDEYLWHYIPHNLCFTNEKGIQSYAFVRNCFIHQLYQLQCKMTMC